MGVFFADCRLYLGDRSMSFLFRLPHFLSLAPEDKFTLFKLGGCSAHLPYFFCLNSLVLRVNGEGRM